MVSLVGDGGQPQHAVEARNLFNRGKLSHNKNKPSLSNRKLMCCGAAPLMGHFVHRALVFWRPACSIPTLLLFIYPSTDP
jgi:hypothetical protein